MSRSRRGAPGHGTKQSSRAEPGASRLIWLLAFYDEAELQSLALTAYLALGDWSTAEYDADRYRATLSPHMRLTVMIRRIR